MSFRFESQCHSFREPNTSAYFKRQVSSPSPKLQRRHLERLRPLSSLIHSLVKRRVSRVSISRMLDETPFFLVRGRDLILPQDVLTGHANFGRNQSSSDLDEYKLNQLRALKIAFDKLNRHKQQAQAKYKEYYNKSHRQVSFQIKDQVLVFFGIPKQGLAHKLLPQWEGPYEITGKIDSVTYRVALCGHPNKTFLSHVQRSR